MPALDPGPPSFCPRCRAVTGLFDLKPDSSRSLISIACPACHAKGEPPMGPSPPADCCPACEAPIYSVWRFCVFCGRAHALVVAHNAEIARGERGWWYLSFAADDGFLGAVLVLA